MSRELPEAYLTDNGETIAFENSRTEWIESDIVLPVNPSDKEMWVVVNDP